MFSNYTSNYHDTNHTSQTNGTRVLSSGTLSALPNYICNPRVLEDWYIVYITKGRGLFTCSDNLMPICEGNLFFLFPGVLHAYQTDNKHLLTQQWVGFNGPEIPSMLASLNISPKNPLTKNIQNKEELVVLFNKLLSSADDATRDNNLYRTGILYQILGLITRPPATSLIPSKPVKDFSHTIDKAIAYMEAQYRTALTIDDLLRHVSLSKSAFFTKFKKEVGTSPGDYITGLRLEEARYLIQHTQIPIKDVAERIGYKDPLYFSRIFSEHVGASPSQFRKRLNTFHPDKGGKGSVNL